MAAIFVMCALGVSDVPGAADNMMPVRPWEARKHASEAPAGPAPTMRNGVSMTCSSSPLIVVETMLIYQLKRANGEARLI